MKEILTAICLVALGYVAATGLGMVFKPKPKKLVTRIAMYVSPPDFPGSRVGFQNYVPDSLFTEIYLVYSDKDSTRVQ